MVEAGEVLRTPAHRVSRRALWYWTVREALIGLALTVVAFSTRSTLDDGSDWLSDLADLVPWLVLAGAVIATATLPGWRWRVHHWEVTEHAVHTLEGALSRDWRIVPLVRIQTVDVEQGFAERPFGIARLVIKTASYSGSTSVAGLDAEVAGRLAAQLTEKLRRMEDDGT